MKQTAVEYLWNRLFEIKKTIPFDDQAEAILNAYHEAKKMEKEQIIDAYQSNAWGEPEGAEQYYNETYGS